MKLKAKPKIPKVSGFDKNKLTSKLNSKPSSEQVEINEAVAIYLKESGARRFLFWQDNRQLYERPWFLVIGPQGSGKTSLFTHCGIDFPLIYPSIDDGYIPGESTQPSIVWWFHHDSVWLDLPGRIIEENNRKGYKEIIDKLGIIRPKRPMDGIVLVLDCSILLNNDTDEIKSLAANLRKSIENVISMWGIELPVYLLFNKTDKIDGFNEFFSDQSGRWSERILGSTITGTEIDNLPRLAFLEEFERLIGKLQDIRLRLLAKEKNRTIRTGITRFPIEMEGLREKTALFVATLFKQSSFKGKPCLGGFYFCSCREVMEKRTVSQMLSGDIASDILDHPLNPKRKKSKQQNDSSKLSRKHSFFLKPLLSSVIPQSSAPICATSLRYRNELISLCFRVGIAVMLTIAFIIILIISSSRIIDSEKKVKTDFDKKIDLSVSGIQHLGTLHKHYKNTMPEKRGFAHFVTGHNTYRSYKAITKRYRKILEEVLIEPCFDMLERDLMSMQSARVTYGLLRNTLEAYLAISDRSYEFPAIFKRDSLITKTLVKRIKTALGPQVPWKSGIDNNLEKSISDALMFIKNRRADFLPHANETVVDYSQRHLVSLLDSRAIYKFTIEKCYSFKNNLKLSDIIDQPLNKVVLHSKHSLNEIYTPQGWKEAVLPQIKNASVYIKDIEPWIVGKYKTELLRSPIDPAALTSDLVKQYLEDVYYQWGNFLSSCSPDRFRNLAEAQKVLNIISGKKSPVTEILSRFSQWSKEFTIKDTIFGISLPLNEFSDRISFISEFYEDLYPEYQKSIQDLAKVLTEANVGTFRSRLFNGDVTDPLVVLYSVLERDIFSVLDENKERFLKSVLSAPYTFTVSLLEDTIRNELNTKWHKDVFEPFTRMMAKRYPFSNSKQEAVLDIVMTFFQPEKGPIWRLYNTSLNKRLVRTESGWRIIENSGAVKLDFNRLITRCFTQACHITDLFYNNDGSQRIWRLTIFPESRTISRATLQFDNQSFDLLNRDGTQIMWPEPARSYDGSIRMTDKTGNTGKIYFNGQWGLMKIMNLSALRIHSTHHLPVFNTSFETRTHGGVVKLRTKVEVNLSSHPFCSNCFLGFSIPEKLIQN